MRLEYWASSDTRIPEIPGAATPGFSIRERAILKAFAKSPADDSAEEDSAPFLLSQEE